MVLLLQYTLIFASVLMLVALGGCGIIAYIVAAIIMPEKSEVI